MGSLSLVLAYELELRKTAYRYVRDGVCACLETALDKACEAPALYSVHFAEMKLDMEFSGGDQLAEPTKGKGKVTNWHCQTGLDASAVATDPVSKCRIHQ